MIEAREWTSPRNNALCASSAVRVVSRDHRPSVQYQGHWSKLDISMPDRSTAAPTCTPPPLRSSLSSSSLLHGGRRHLSRLFCFSRVQRPRPHVLLRYFLSNICSDSLSCSEIYRRLKPPFQITMPREN